MWTFSGVWFAVLVTGQVHGRANVPAQISNETVPIMESPFRAGWDAYFGFTNLPAMRRTRDGVWAGESTSLPSNMYVAWNGTGGQSAKVSLGAGRNFTARNTGFEQPAEAWYEKSFGEFAFRAGKYWVPFGLQEWEYEPKTGMMAQWNHKAISASVSSNQNFDTYTNNTYLRICADVAKGVNVGVSWASGRGLMFNSSHDKAIGADASVSLHHWNVSGEAIEAHNRGNTPFRFGFVKTAYQGFGKWMPWVGYYGWSDRSGELGDFHSTVFGLGYQITPQVAIESGVAGSTNGDVRWLQFHWTWEH
jgi:hypothetical protein